MDVFWVVVPTGCMGPVIGPRLRIGCCPFVWETDAAATAPNDSHKLYVRDIL